MRRSFFGGLAVLVAGGVAATAAVASTTGDPASDDRQAARTGTQPPAAPQQGSVSKVVAPRSEDALKRDIDKILSDPRLTGAQAGVLVRDAKTGAGLYERGVAGKALPASNQKLQTTAAAFGVLGPGHTFKTGVYAGPRQGPAVRGLYLKGTGDPTLRAADYDRLAAKVAASGVKKVAGALVADDTYFDAKRLPDGWDPADEQYSYAAQVSALTMSPDADFNAGSVQVNVAPGTQGKPVKATLSPAAGYVRVDNKAKTGAPGSASTLAINRPRGSNTIQITGSYPADGAKVEELRSVHEPSLYAAAAFREALQKRGVRVTGPTRRGGTPAGASRLALRSSMPLSKLAVPYLKLSNNNIAEILVKAMGRKTTGAGDWPAGLQATRAYLKGLGVDTSQLTSVDGSGLSRSNRTTPAQLGTLLRAIRGKSWFPAYYNAMPIAGRADPMVGGTLAERMKGTAAAGNVHGKTGTLTGATALSGYVQDPKGRRLLFSIILNGYKGDAPKDIEDKIAVRLAAGRMPSATALRAPRTAVNPLAGRPGAGLECSWIGTC